METGARGTVSIEAVVFPPCKCGLPYTPDKPVVDYGTIHFQSKDRIATLLYKFESLIKRLRLYRLRSL